MEVLPEKIHEGAAALEKVMHLSNLYIHKNYLQHLEQMSIVEPSHEIEKIEVGKNLRIIHVEGILHDAQDNLSDKIKSLFGAVSAFEAGVMLILQAKGDRAKFYIGICGTEMEVVTPAFNTFLSSLRGILPGCRCRNLKTPEVVALMEEIFPTKVELNGAREALTISAVSAFPRTYQNSAAPYAEIEKIDVLLDGMRGKPFSMIFLTKTMSREILVSMQHQMELLYTQLLPFERQSISVSESDSDSVNLNYSRAVVKNQSYNTGIVRTVSDTHGTGTIQNEQIPDENSMKMQAKLGLLGTAASLAVPLAGMALLSGPSLALAGVLGSFYGAGISSMATNAGILTGVIPNKKNISTGSSAHDDHTESSSKNFSFSVSSGTTDSSGYSVGNSKTFGNSRQYTITNKSLSILLQELEREIHVIQSLGREGAFCGAAYFVAGDTENAVTAANLYRSMTESKLQNHSMSSWIYRWNNRPDVDKLVKYLSRGIHPDFILENEPNRPTVEVAQIIGLNDIPVYFSFPKKSIPGIVISDCAGFSRDIIIQDSPLSDAPKERTIKAGSIYHLGKTETQSPVLLKIDDLTKHLFVSGATGVGKSNFCYQILDQLSAQGIKMLVIEPAKGEYAGVLGGNEGFHVFGTEAMRAPLLRINPFAFPEGISAVQHVERLLSIFNTAWTMYDAMPAILKEAIEKIYLDKGFDLYFGGRPEGANFPSFADLLEALPNVIQNSSYSAEVKGNYTGALVTRVKSLTNGLYRVIFGRDEIGDEILFQENVIVDLSRIGSPETKALLMGILTMRLLEFRMCEGKVNSRLRHVTVLEEAHNLLRRESAGGSAVGVNMRAASVEMISNAIAEMRTYGEGFIIADQSPSVLDMSVIRNTHTKVFFMLPDKNDREISGNSITLNEAQKKEIARLSPGVAVVFQNGWTDAVLCKIDRFRDEKICPFVYRKPTTLIDFRTLNGQAIAVVLSNSLPSGKVGSASVEKIRELCKGAQLVVTPAVEILSEYERTGKFKRGAEICKELIAQLIPLEKIIRESAGQEKWGAVVEAEISKMATLSTDELIMLVQLGISWYAPKTEVGRLRAKYLGYRNFLEKQGRH